jgi:ABC-type sugar transport system ATPase subunit
MNTRSNQTPHPGARDVEPSSSIPTATAEPLGRVRPPARLNISGVSVTFGRNRVLREVGFEVGAGEIHALIGQNGSGKSTLVKVLTGLYAAAAGCRVLVASSDENELSMLRDRSLVVRDGRVDQGLSGPRRPDDIVVAIFAATDRRPLRGTLPLSGIKERVRP